MLNLVDALKQLVAIPSVNPMGGNRAGPQFGEARLTDHLESVFQRLGLVCQRQPVEPGRENIVGRLEGRPARGSVAEVLLFSAHQDTVPVAGMTIAPFEPRVASDRLYGRGACDVKGGLAAMLVAVSRLGEERPAGMPTVVLACTVNEECGFTGADALPRLWNDLSGSLLPRKPDAAVVAEPTGLDVVVAHKGLVRWRCHTRGRAAHGAYPEQGDSALYKMARVLAALERYHREVLAGRPAHPLCGGPTLNVGTIAGGTSVNTVPDHCTIEIERRLTPEESPQEARQEVIDHLARELNLGPDLQHDDPFMRGLALGEQSNRGLADRLAGVVRRVAGTCRTIGVAYATDAASLAAAGVPTVVFGPGSVEQAHTADEWIALDSVEKAAEVYYRLAKLRRRPG
jgi:acetylornithine deacetylase